MLLFMSYIRFLLYIQEAIEDIPKFSGAVSSRSGDQPDRGDTIPEDAFTRPRRALALSARQPQC